MSALQEPSAGPLVESEAGLVSLLHDARFEVLPTEGIENEVTDSLAPGTTVHVVCPAALGADVSVRFAINLARQGYKAIPHVAARTVRDVDHLRELLERMTSAGIRAGFFPGGDGKTQAGPYESAVDLLDDLGGLDHGLSEIGVTCYPEGHPAISRDVLLEVLLRKQRLASFMVSESCLDPSKTLLWLQKMRAAGVTLPLMVGVPGIVPIRRLFQAFTQFGLDAALSYLRKQHGMIRALARRRFSPAEVVFGLTPHALDPDLQIGQIHFFTFNEVAATEAWRTKVLDRGS